MNVFEAVKQSVTTRQAASFYGIRVGRNGMVCCPFHNDRTPSMSVDSRFYCFGCGASGDVIDFSALLHGLGKREAAVRLAAVSYTHLDVYKRQSMREFAMRFLLRWQLWQSASRLQC